MLLYPLTQIKWLSFLFSRRRYPHPHQLTQLVSRGFYLVHRTLPVGVAQDLHHIIEIFWRYAASVSVHQKRFVQFYRGGASHVALPMTEENAQLYQGGLTHFSSNLRKFHEYCSNNNIKTNLYLYKLTYYAYAID